ncbi:hypothetical protein BDK51DRAFT_12503, partial [Blyttiomyces helicus]
STSPANLLFVGILTMPLKFERRSLIRMTYLRLKPPTVTVAFVICLPGTPEAARLIALEQSFHRDILVLNCTENMDNGKTYSYFSTVGAPGFSFAGISRWDYVMKTDDDVFIMLPNIADKLADKPREGFFFGRKVSGFMAGLGYVLSWDLVEWIARDPFPKNDRIGQEDYKTAGWLAKSHLVKHWVSEDNEIYDEPSSGKGWAHPYTPDTLIVHRMKASDAFLTGAMHFVGSAF